VPCGGSASAPSVAPRGPGRKATGRSSRATRASPAHRDSRSRAALRLLRRPALGEPPLHFPPQPRTVRQFRGLCTSRVPDGPLVGPPRPIAVPPPIRRHVPRHRRRTAPQAHRNHATRLGASSPRNLFPLRQRQAERRPGLGTGLHASRPHQHPLHRLGRAPDGCRRRFERLPPRIRCCSSVRSAAVSDQPGSLPHSIHRLP
jgi:hypothetical protein